MAGPDAIFYEPSRGHGLRHEPFNAIVGPRPVGWISSASPAGVFNLAPYSYFNAVNYSPPIVAFSSIGWKDSVANIEATGEFVCNLATKALADRMNLTAAHVAPGVDEFALAGLRAVPGRVVSAPCVLESPVNLECRVSQFIQLKSAGGEELRTWLVLGEVVAVHIDPALIEDGVYQTALARPILRAGRLGDYAEITPAAMFEMARPD